MPRIRILDQVTANQIAAGEVVERPASVVKELVENSIDAGATRVVVEVEGGGRDLIRVTDDGCGMSADDARLALERHATSKIASGADLARITTLGFRGEALPSIAAVSRLELRTREAASLSGTRIAVHGGQVAAVEECGCAPGTRVEVRDLFYNTPARLKYLKTNATELGRVGDVLGRLALAHPQVAVRYRSGPAEVFATPGRGEVLEAAGAVLGREVVRELVPVTHAAGAVRVTGYVGLPAASRAGRALQYFFVNGRPVQALALRYALEEAYANLIPQGRYPVCVIFVEVDPTEVDVNVHPAKLEVRFQHERDVRGAVYRGARAALGSHFAVPGSLAGGEAAATASAEPGRAWQQAGRGIPAWARPAHAPGQAALPTGGAYTGSPHTGGAYTGSPHTGGAYTGSPAAGAGMAHGGTAREGAAAYGAAGAIPAPAYPPGAAAEDGAELALRPAGALPRNAAELVRSLRPLGQVHRSYIACDGPEGLYLLDQHAAHERIFFERFMATADAPLPVQPLLFPVTLELTAAQSALLAEHTEVLAGSGLQVQPFGGGTVLIQSVPAGVPEGAAARLLTDFLDRLADHGPAPASSPLDRRQRALAALAACKAAIKARDALQPEELAALLADLAACQNPGQCPHGRPTIIAFPISDLEKRFGRA